MARTTNKGGNGVDDLLVGIKERWPEFDVEGLVERFGYAHIEKRFGHMFARFDQRTEEIYRARFFERQTYHTTAALYDIHPNSVFRVIKDRLIYIQDPVFIAQLLYIDTAEVCDLQSYYVIELIQPYWNNLYWRLGLGMHYAYGDFDQTGALMERYRKMTKLFRFKYPECGDDWTDFILRVTANPKELKRIRGYGPVTHNLFRAICSAHGVDIPSWDELS